MAYTPVTAALLRALRRYQGRHLRENAADIGIHRDRCVCPGPTMTDTSCPVHGEDD